MLLALLFIVLVGLHSKIMVQSNAKGIISNQRFVSRPSASSVGNAVPSSSHNHYSGSHSSSLYKEIDGKLYKLVSELSKCGPRLNMYLAQDILHILVPPGPVPNIIYNLNSTGRGSWSENWKLSGTSGEERGQAGRHHGNLPPYYSSPWVLAFTTINI